MPPIEIHPGDIIYSWCSEHRDKDIKPKPGEIVGQATKHRWDGHKLTCMVCEYEQQAAQGAANAKQSAG